MSPASQPVGAVGAINKLAEAIDTIDLAGPADYSTAHFVAGVKHLPIRYRFKT